MSPARRAQRKRVRRERSFLVTVPVRIHVVAPMSKDEAIRVAAGFVGDALRSQKLPRDMHSWLLLDARGEPIRYSGSARR